MIPRKVRLCKNDENVCRNCGDEQIVSRTFSDTVEFRGLQIDVEGLQEFKCSACGYIWASEAQDSANNSAIRAAYVIARDKKRSDYGLLSGEEIARIREDLGLNQKIAASLFGGGSNAFNKYESGEVLQSFAMDRLLRIAKIIGAPVVQFLSNVNDQAPFVVVPTRVTGNTMVQVIGFASSGYVIADVQPTGFERHLVQPNKRPEFIRAA